jgi:ATP-binding cassette subfamily C protein
MKTYFDIWRDAYAHSGYRVWILMLLLLLVGVSDGVSMALLYPLLETIGLGSSANQGAVGATFRWLFNSLGLEMTLTSACLVLISTVLIQGVLLIAQNWLMTDIQKKYIASWQRQMFADFIAAKWSFFVSQRLGEMLNLIMNESFRVGAAFYSILQLLIAGIILVVYLAISLFISWKVTLYLLVCGLILLVVVEPIRRATRRYGEEFNEIQNEFNSTLHEMLSGAKFIKASAGGARANNIVSLQIDRVRQNLSRSQFLPTTIRSSFEFAGILMIIGAMIYGLKIEQVGAAQLLVLIALLARLLPRLIQLQQFQSLLNLTAPGFTVAQAAHALFGEHRERPSQSKDVDPATIVPSDLSAKDLTVRYGEVTVLDRVNFSIPTGATIGFVGPSGAGKSTLVDVILGLLEPTTGKVFVGDVPLDRVDRSGWLKRIGYVAQDTFLFHDTIANNIRWNTPDASMEEVRAAGQAALLDNFIDGLPLGYETIVGDRGVKLSGGQRQRISIARALIRRPGLLLLDEATSALDSLSEREIMDVIHGLKRKMTVVIVAHRLATVREADIIYVFDHGRIVEQGSWDVLSGDKALFHRLMQAQAVTGT